VVTHLAHPRRALQPGQLCVAGMVPELTSRSAAITTRTLASLRSTRFDNWL
jgi:hypothetical protein